MTKHRIDIVLDCDPPNPRKDFDHVGKLDVRGRHNSVDFSETTYHEEDDKNVFAVLPVYRYEHGGVAYNTTGFSCPWDSGQVGWIVAYRDDVFKAWGFKRRTKRALATVLACLTAEVEELSQWANGDVYGYRIVDEGTGDVVDDCYGYYGHDAVTEAARDAMTSIESTSTRD